MRKLTILCYKNKGDLADLNVNHILNGHPQVVGEKFVSIVEEHMENGLCVAIASYSNTIINLTGHLIAKGILKPTQVKWVICDKDLKVDGRCRRGVYNSDGRLVNWVYGYFLPSSSIIEDAFYR